VVEGAGESGDSRLPPELVTAVARSSEIPLDLRTAFLDAAAGEPGGPAEPGPWFPAAARRRAHLHRVELSEEPLAALEGLMEKAEARRSSDLWLAAAEFLDSRGEDLARGTLETLIRRGMGAAYAEARQAFFGAGRRHLGPDVREWAPADVLRREGRGASKKRHPRDPDQNSLF